MVTVGTVDLGGWLLLVKQNHVSGKNKTQLCSQNNNKKKCPHLCPCDETTGKKIYLSNTFSILYSEGCSLVNLSNVPKSLTYSTSITEMWQGCSVFESRNKQINKTGRTKIIRMVEVKQTETENFPHRDT